MSRNFATACLPLCLLFQCLALVPAWSAGISVVGSLTRELTLQPGERAEGQLLIRNSTDQARPVKVFQADYLFHADGTNYFGDPGTAPRSNASWIAFAPPLLTIPPHQTMSVDYLIRVPEDRTLAGTYWSVLIVEPVSQAALDPQQLKSGQIAVSTVFRYAVQMVTHIGNSGRTEIKFIGRQMTREAGGYRLTLDAENTGERGLRPQVWVQLFDAEGRDLGRFPGERLRLYPGCSVRFHVDLPPLPAGNYHALAVADDNGEQVFGARYELSIE